MLVVISNSLMGIVHDRISGKYNAPATVIPRPDVPTPDANTPEHLFEAFALAEEAAAEGNLAKAEILFQQVIKADPDGLGAAAVERLSELKFERDRATAYLNVVRLAGSPATLKGAQATWRVYLQKYGADHDPQDIADKLNPPVAPPIPAKPVTPEPKTRSKVFDILPTPFEWCAIPAGKVTLEY